MKIEAHQAVIFDMDGLMFNTEQLRQAGWVGASMQFGYYLCQETFRCTLGKRADEVRQSLIEAIGPDFPIDQIKKVRDAAIRNIIQTEGTPIKDGLLELLNALEMHQIPFAIGTSSNKEVTDFQLGNANLPDRFKIIVTGEEVERSKPEPDIFLKVSEKLQIEPKNCFVLEDSESGIEAAHRAGMRPIHVEDILPPSSQIKKIAHFLAKNLIEVREFLFSSNRPEISSHSSI
jgi:HAD superfamily hydrolase (TIGR01509 family)